MIAVHTGQNTVGPGGRSTLGTRQDVVNREFFTAWTAAAVLTHIGIAFENIATTERNNIMRHFVLMG